MIESKKFIYSASPTNLTMKLIVKVFNKNCSYGKNFLPILSFSFWLHDVICTTKMLLQNNLGKTKFEVDGTPDTS